MREEQLYQYVMTEDETKVFINTLLRDPNSQHSAFIIVLLKELNYDIIKFLRVINVGYKTKNLLQRSLLNKVLSTIRESVIIKDIEYRDKLDKITITELSRSHRYQELGISRSLIYKTIYKHNIEVLDK